MVYKTVYKQSIPIYFTMPTFLATTFQKRVLNDWDIVFLMSYSLMNDLLHGQKQFTACIVLLPGSKYIFKLFPMTIWITSVDWTVVISGGATYCTSLSRLASRWRGLSDMTKSRVVDTEGAGPSCSGAYCTLRMARATVLLLGTKVGRVEPQQLSLRLPRDKELLRKFETQTESQWP